MRESWSIVTLSVALWAATSFGSPTVLRESEVAREFDQRTWTHEHGLPDDRVKAILQTRDGYLWIGTPRGLARFDGLKFTVFDHFNTPELVNDDCWGLTEDGEGNLWVGTSDGVVRLRGNRFRRFTSQDGVQVASPLCRSLSGGVWTAGSACICRIHDRNTRAYGIENGFPESRDSVRALEEDDRGVPWLATFAGLIRFDPKRERFELGPMQKEFERLPAAAIRRDSGGKLWVVFCDRLPVPQIKGGKCWLACFKNGIWIRTPNLAREDFVADHWGAFIAEDAFGALWLQAGDNGVHRFVGNEFQFLPMPHKTEQEIALCACSDREGNLWFGTEASGLQRWSRRKVLCYTTREGLAHDNVWSICEARDGSVLVGSDGGVSRFKDERFTNLLSGEDAAQKYVRSVVEDRSGAIWVGTMRTVESTTGGKRSQIKLPGDWAETKIRVLLPARDGAMWIGSVRGLTRLQGAKSTKYTRAEGLGSDEVRALLEDRAGDLLIGTFGGGLSRLHEGHLTTLTTTNGLSSDNVWALYEDSEGALWIGADNGLNRLKDGRITGFTTARGLPDNQVNCILEDNFGRLWISYDHGIYWVHKQRLIDVISNGAALVDAVRYDESDGLLSTETNGQKSNPAACKTRDGRLWFPTTKGVAVFDPSKVVNDEVPPLTVVEQIRANGKVLFDNSVAKNGHSQATPRGADKTFSRSDAPTLQRSNAPRPPVHLPAGGARVLEFRYTANAFTAPEKAQFRYRLVGLDNHWMDGSTRRETYFTDLRPGDYRFEVIARNHHGVWPGQGAIVALHLAPFFYQTWWFYVGTGCVTAALLALTISWRGREVQRIHQLEQTNALNEQRKQIARDIHDELGASLTHIVQLSGETRRSLAQPEKLEAQTNRIASIAEEAVDNIGEIVWANNPNYDTLEDLVSYLREYAASFFALSPVQVYFDFPETVPPITVTSLFRRHLLMLVKEALQNVMKHAAAKKVRVSVALHDTILKLSIVDDGRGLPSDSERLGDGLTNMRHRVVELDGSIEIISRPGAGAEIRVRVPLTT